MIRSQAPTTNQSISLQQTKMQASFSLNTPGTFIGTLTSRRSETQLDTETASRSSKLSQTTATRFSEICWAYVMRRTIKVVLVYFAIVALGWVDFTWGDEPGLIETTPTSVPVIAETVPVVPVVGPIAVAPTQEPDWSPIVIPRGEYRDHIKAMPIEDRPYRPLHFYGNTIRRNHYRGNPLPMPRDIGKTATELIRRR